jgi:hypothetical protein
MARSALSQQLTGWRQPARMADDPRERILMQSAERLAGPIRRHRKSIVLVSSALVLASAGTASAATVSPAAHAPIGIEAAATRQLPAHADSLHPGDSAVVQHLTGALPHPALLPVHQVRAHTVARAARHLRPANWHRVVPAANRLLPVATAGPQNFIPVSQAQYANAATIVHQALAKRMGVRSAVIAVATAMQESKLLNLNYGTGDSLGLFQQQWDMGWGSPQQIMNPAYASDKFLEALHTYQATDPAWAAQPLYQAAQGVQRSAFPFAYAQWERQAAQLTSTVLHGR